MLSFLDKTTTIAWCFLHSEDGVNGRDPLQGIFSLYLWSCIHSVAVNCCTQSLWVFCVLNNEGRDSVIKQDKTKDVKLILGYACSMLEVITKRLRALQVWAKRNSRAPRWSQKLFNIPTEETKLISNRMRQWGVHLVLLELLTAAKNNSTSYQKKPN